jgi:type IV secretion system protein VirB10
VSEKVEASTLKMDAPSGLDLNPRPPRAVRVSKRAGGALMALAALILGLFAYGGYRRQQRQVATLADNGIPRSVAPATVAGAEIAKAVPSGDVPTAAHAPIPASSGFLQAPEDLEQRSTDRNQTQSAPPVIVRQTPVAPVAPVQPVSHEPTPEERRLIAAYEREQQALVASTSSQIRFGSLSSLQTLSPAVEAPPNGWNSPPATNRVDPSPQPPRTPNGADQDDQNMQAMKEAFLLRARTLPAEDYLKSIRTAPLSKYEIKAGWEIPAVLEQALNSDLPGELKALVSSNVYDTASGRYLLIPQGARLVGVYSSRIGYGQDGVQVIWDRIIYPDASSLDLSGMVGQDAHGSSGFRETVDHHYKRLVGFAVLTSLFAAASEISQNQNRSLLTYPTPAQLAGSAVGQQASELGAQVTRRNLNVQPTIKVNAGYRFNVRVNRDIVFDSPYQPLAIR